MSKNIGDNDPVTLTMVVGALATICYGLAVKLLANIRESIRDLYDKCNKNAGDIREIQGRLDERRGKK